MKRLQFQPANAYTVQLDIDTSEDLVLFHKHIPWLNCIMAESGEPLRAFSQVRSRSGKRWHVEIKLCKPKPIMWRIAVAAFMGSDRSRELCNFERVMCNSKYPMLFWKKASNNGNASNKRNRKSNVDKLSPLSVRRRNVLKES